MQEDGGAPVTSEWLAASLADADGRGPAEVIGQVCRAAVRPLEVSGLAVIVLSGGRAVGTVCASDETAKGLEALQFSLGEGPSIDAHRSRVPVAETDLGRSHRWPAFAPEANDAGVQATFAFPLQVGAARFGALELHRREVGSMTEGAFAEAIEVARAATVLVLALLADVPPGMMPLALEDATAARAHVHQVTGMVSAMLQIDTAEALVRLRARAYADSRTLGDLSADVVSRLIRFER